MRILKMDQDRVNDIGRQGENDATAAVFDVTGWSAMYGEGFFEVIHKIQGYEAPYPCNISVDRDSVTWNVKSSDLVSAGYGECELTYIVDNVIAKSVKYFTHIISSVEGAGEDPPPPYESRIQDLIRASAGIQQNIGRAEAAAESSANSASESYEHSKEAEAFKNEAAGVMGLATFEIDIETGELRVRYPNPYYGATFRINEDGYLEVIRHACRRT